MKILIIGASGMAGHLISTYFSEKKYNVITLSSTHPFDDNTYLIDVCNIHSLENFLVTHPFDVVVNCAGILIKASEQNKTNAILVNAYLPHYLEQFYMHTSTRLIHLSTDCVFSGLSGPYIETSSCDGSLFYDKTKALGEINNTKDLTFRMSIIGPDPSSCGVGLFNWFLQQHGEVYGYTNVYWNGITTLELAKAIDAAIIENLTGLYHLTQSNPISKYNLLLLIKQIFKLDTIDLLPKEVVPINKSLTNTRTDFQYTLPNYDTMLKDMGDWITHHSNLYPHYIP